MAILATIVLLRLLTLSFPDLVDSTEGRYGSIAKNMLDRNDWITPWINLRGVEVPYNGKPPLHFWLMQISYLLFGYTSFAARLPGVLSALGIGLLLGLAARARLGATAGYVAAIVFASSTMTFFLSGAAVLDMTLTFGTTLTILGFLLAERRKGFGPFGLSNVWGYLAFVGAGIGMLVKGPLAVVLPGLVAVPWMIVRRVKTGAWPKQFGALPWITGPLLFLAIAAPWFIMAEIKTPGFLYYFFIAENLGRLYKKDYGDLYGSGHRQPFGAAWAMMVPALVPWTVALMAWFIRAWAPAVSPFLKIRKQSGIKAAVSRVVAPPFKAASRKIELDEDLLFGFLWTICCPLLLLAARQYTGTYIVPSIPGFAFLAAGLWTRCIDGNQDARHFMYRLMRGLTVLLAVLTITGAIIGVSRYGTPGALAAIAVVVAFAYVASLFINSAEQSALKEIGRLAMCTAITYALASICWNNHLSNNRSTRRLLEVIASLSRPDAEVRVGFPVYFPFSATFYGPLARNPAVKIVNLEDDQIPGADVDVLVARDRNEKELLGIDPSLEGRKIAEVGQWNIYRVTGKSLRQDQTP